MTTDRPYTNRGPLWLRETNEDEHAADDCDVYVVSRINELALQRQSRLQALLSRAACGEAEEALAAEDFGAA